MGIEACLQEFAAHSSLIRRRLHASPIGAELVAPHVYRCGHVIGTVLRCRNVPATPSPGSIHAFGVEVVWLLLFSKLFGNISFRVSHPMVSTHRCLVRGDVNKHMLWYMLYVAYLSTSISS